MYYLRLILVLAISIGLRLMVTAQISGKQFIDTPFTNNVFIKEQGQFTRNAKEFRMRVTEPILYGVENAEFNAYFTAHGITFQFPERKSLGKIKSEEPEQKEKKGKDERKEEQTIETIWHSATMQWLNTNPSSHIEAQEKVNDYYNYDNFIDDKIRYDFVPAYKKLKYYNLYPGVDIEFELPAEGGIKYKLIVKPNVAVPAISFQWDGLEKISIDEKGDLNLQSKFNSFDLKNKWLLIDHAPNAFSSKSHTNIPVRYNVVDDGKVELKFLSEHISSSEGIVIDPWITNTSFPDINRAFDIQEDAFGNVFVIGNHSNWQVQKYDSFGVLQWTYVTYAILMGDIAVDNPGNVYIIGGYSAGKRQKLNSSGVQLWSLAGLSEEWRLAFNYSKTVLAIGGYFVNPGGNNMAKLDVNTGAVSDQIIYGEETRGLATDCNGDIYSLHVTFNFSGIAASNLLRKTNADFTPAGSLVDGFLLAEAQPAGTGYGYNPAYSPDIYQVLNAIVVNGPYVFIYDGATIRRINKTALTILNSTSVPNGAVTLCGGIVADLCGNIYVGSTTGIEKFDSTLTHIASIAAPGPVYDLIVSKNGDLLACGNGFLGRFANSCTPPAPFIVVDSSTSASCIGGTATVIASGGTPPYSYLWSPGGQTTSSITNLTAGTYTCTVTDPFCHTYTDVVTVNQKPALSLSRGLTNVISPGVVSNESCLGSFDGSATVVANGGTAPYYYSWNTNPVQQTQTATGLSAGIYLATVIDDDYCIDTVSITITSNPAPTANFTFTNKCSGTAVPFNSTSTSTAPDAITNWNWKFGDNTIGTGSSISHLYSAPGNYNVTLIVTTNNSCSDTIVHPITVFNNAVAGFTYNNVCLGDSMHFTNTSTVILPDAITGYLWDFGYSGNISNVKNPAHQYVSPGTFNVTLVTTTSNGCSDESTIPVNIYDPPTSAFTVNNTCLADSVLFSNTTLSPAMGTTASWSWNFGDGSALETSTFSPKHLYPSVGNYTITLISKSSNLGCPDTITQSITVYPMPVADFNAADVCQNQIMNFDDLTTVTGSSTIASWSWNFGDATAIGVAQNPVHTYANPGSYSGTLIVTSSSGCKDTITKNVIVHPLPVAIISTNNTCTGITSQFMDQSVIVVNPTNDVIQSWGWDYGDGSPVAANQNTSHLYTNAGSYPVELLISSSFGCLDSVTQMVFIHPNPSVNFVASDTVGCEPLCISLQNGSAIATGNLSYVWNFGDGSGVSNSIESVHCYTNDSTFSPNVLNVTLTAVSDSGCAVSLTKNNYITVYPLPNAAFTIQPQTITITDPVITFNNVSSGSNVWHWNFGDMDTSLLQHPPDHTYADTGTYSITLIASTLYNCIDTMYQAIVIEPDFAFYVPNAFTPNEDGINDTFTGTGMFIKNFEMMIFDRWGNLMFSTDNINKPWDGRKNNGNEIAQQDVYVYSIKLSDFKKRNYTYKGIVTLVR